MRPSPYAIHCPESGDDIRTARELLGHDEVRTTQTDTRMLNRAGKASEARLMYDASPMNRNDFDPAEHELPLPSKSQLKREAEAVQALGRQLVELPAARYAAVMARLDLPENLREAITACRAINARGGRKRQLQYIGKLMRGIDADPVRRVLATLEGSDRAQTALLHRLERWRERLIAEGDGALAELLDEYPAADRRRLRQLAVNARKERDAGQAPAAARALFRALRALFDDDRAGQGE